MSSYGLHYISKVKKNDTLYLIPTMYTTKECEVIIDNFSKCISNPKNSCIVIMNQLKESNCIYNYEM